MRADWTALWRRWRRRPGLPACALVVLVAGVGPGAAVLGAVYAALLRGLPYPDAGRLVIVQAAFPGMRLSGMGLSGPEAVELRDFTRAFADVGFGYLAGGVVDTGRRPIRAEVARVSAGLLAALAVTPAAGRAFAEADDVPGGPCRVVLSRRFRDAAFEPARSPIGATVRVDGRPCEVVGIWPDRVDFAGRPADVWAPLHYDVRSPSSNRANHAFTVLARIAPDLSVDDARADLARAVDGWTAATGQLHSPGAQFHPLSIAPLDDWMRGPVRSAGRVLLLAVATLIVITIANAAALLVAEADRRRQELTLRAVLGADRRRLWRMHALETGMLAGIAAVGGAAIALAGARLIAALAPATLARFDLALPPWQTSAMAGALAAVAAAVGSLLQTTRLPRRLAATFGDDGRGSTASGGRQRVRRALVGVEVALAVALVTAAVVMAEVVGRLTRVDPGFRADGVLHAQVNLPADRYDTRPRIDAFYDALGSALRRRPDVAAVGAMTGPLPERTPNNSSIVVDGAAADPHLGTPPVQFVQFLTPESFAALGVGLRRGRLFTPADTAASQPVVIVNERAARTYFGERDPIGWRIRPMAPGTPWFTVVGVVADARQNGLAREAGTEIFFPLAQAEAAFGRAAFARDLHVMVRARTGNASALAPALRAAVGDADAGAAVSGIEPLSAAANRSIAAERFLLALLGSFGTVALLLAAAGVYGVVAHAVAAATREIGVRRALGAPGVSVVRLVALRLLPPIVAGIAAGAALGAAGARLLAPFSYQTDVTSPLRLAGVAAVLLLVAGTACLRPLVAALRIDPAIALRQP